ncbi:response regulator transcription factor [Shimazuella sp. AN120528]|uniref:response regulator transcription factor n=1 Tax=Shimazuella soli TaxID=1892854 RepID=UPI001F0D9E23|nr:response regulator transcription factor [Shimazuella soli]MCH5584927.1 response regulator transcription factor [Shimazuella soli]
MRILVADDEKNITDAIGYALRREGYTVEVAYEGEEAEQKIAAFQPHVAILDIMMPNRSGYEICRKYENRDKMGIILVTAKTDISDKVLGLDLGADDYITKPFDMRELLARVKSLLRRFQKFDQNENEMIQIHDLQIEQKKRRAELNNQPLELTPKEFDLLVLMTTNLERVYSREELLDLIWGMDYIGGTRTVDIHIRRLRQKLGSYKELIQTVHRVGYKAVGKIK